MAERGIAVDHSTLYRWVIKLTALLDKAFRRHKRKLGRRWRMDETYIKIKGHWKHLYRAVDSTGQTIDFLLTAKRDASAALRFFRKAIRHHGEPEVMTIDKVAPIPQCGHTAVTHDLFVGNDGHINQRKIAGVQFLCQRWIIKLLQPVSRVWIGV